MTRQFFQTVSMAAAIALGASAILQQPSQALPSSSPVLSTFYDCMGTGTAVDPFTTVAVVRNGGAFLENIPIIRWTRGSAGGVSEFARCNQVKARFNMLSAAGNSYLKSNINSPGGPIICLTKRNENCDRSTTLLFTLRNRNEHHQALNQLRNLGQDNNAVPLRETSADEGDISIDLNEYIRQQVDQMQRGRASSSKTSDSGSAF
jgi:hypothetical protein